MMGYPLFSTARISHSKESLVSIRNNRERICIISRANCEEISKFILRQASVGFADGKRNSGVSVPRLDKLKGVNIIDKVHHKDNFLHIFRCLTRCGKIGTYGFAEQHVRM
jgi:hypothetical protein